MEIKINEKQIDYVIISDEIKGRYDYKDNSVRRYLLLDELIVDFPKPSLLERMFGMKQKSPKFYPKAFYNDGMHSDIFIMENFIDENVFFVRDNEIYTKPFLTLVLNGNKIGVIPFNSKQEAEEYVTEKFSDLNLKTLKIYDDNRL